MPTVEKVENEHQIKSQSHPLPSACFRSVIYFNTLPWQFIYFYTIIFSGCRTAVKCFHNLWWPVSHYRTWCCSQFEALIKILRWTPCLCVQLSLWHCIPAALPRAGQNLHAHKLWSKALRLEKGSLEQCTSHPPYVRPSSVKHDDAYPSCQGDTMKGGPKEPACGWGTAWTTSEDDNCEGHTRPGPQMQGF